MTRYAAATLLLALSLGRRARGANVMYPDWSRGTGTCLNATVTPPSNYIFVMGNGFLEATLQSCCTRYYGNTAFNDCIIGGGGNVTGTKDYYALWTDNPPRCAADCPTSSGDPACGGLLGPGQAASFGTSEACCAQHFGYLRSEYCVAISGGGQYGGTGKYYLDSSENICVQDCEGIAPCGGIMTQSWVSLYDTIADCCSNKLPNLDSDFCESQSDPAIAATNKWFVDGNLCKKDCAGTGSECGSYTWGLLYDTAAACCTGGLAWVNDDYCASRSDPATNGVNGQAYTNLWFVDYSQTLCVKDCGTASDPACGDIGDANQAASTTLYDTAASCCSTKLGWIDSTSCAASSIAGAASETGTNQWYPDYSTAKRCVQDCPTSSGPPACGGVAPNNGGVPKYATVASCCSERFGWYNQDLCVALSEAGPSGTASTNKWYVDYDAEVCVQDCPDGLGLSCSGNPSSLSEPLYDAPADCCSAKLGYIDGATCASRSMNGGAAPTVGSNQWYPNYGSGLNRCDQDCDTAGTNSCKGILESVSGVQMFDTAESCCSAKFNWVNAELCLVRSSSGGAANAHTGKFYADQQAKMCKGDCPTSSGAPCGGQPTDFSEPLFDTITQCCDTRLSWQTQHVCEQTPAAAAGTDEWWINWTKNKCVKNCEVGSGTSCGGLAESWDAKYSSSGTCCQQPAFAWTTLDNCVFT